MATSLAPTADQIITAALRQLGAVISGSGGSTNEDSDGLFLLNLTVKQLEQDTKVAFNLDSAWSSSAITAGAVSINLAAGELGAVAAYMLVGTTKYELTPMTLEQFTATSDQGGATTGDPKWFYTTRNTQGTVTMFVYPAHASAGTIYYWAKNRIDLFDNNSDTSSLPDAWTRYLVTRLTADWAWDFGKDPQTIQMLEARADAAYESLIEWETQAIQLNKTDQGTPSNREVTK